MSKLVACIGRVGSNEDTARSYDTLDQDRVVEIVERVYTDDIAFLQTSSMETSYKLANKHIGLTRGDRARGVGGVDVYLTCLAKALSGFIVGRTGLS